MNKVKTTLHCHNCGQDFTAELDMDLNGNHEIECPHCEHIHYRVVEDGEVTAERYDSSNRNTYSAQTWTMTSSYTTPSSSSSVWLSDSWSSSTSSSSYWGS